MTLLHVSRLFILNRTSPEELTDKERPLSPSSSLNYPAAAERWSGGQHVTRPGSAMPHNGSIILEVTRSLQRTTGWLQWSLANTSLWNLHRPARKRVGWAGKVRVGPCCGERTPKISPKICSSIEGRNTVSPFLISLGEKGPKSLLHCLCSRVSTSLNAGVGKYAWKGIISKYFQLCGWHVVCCSY